MRVLYLFIACLLFGKHNGAELNEKGVKTEVKEVPVFIEGAQLARYKTVEGMSAVTSLKFVNLSPFIDAKSVQVKAFGDVTVL